MYALTLRNHYIVRTNGIVKHHAVDLGGKLMTKRTILIWGVSVTTLSLIAFISGCGEDPAMYQGETLTFETPVSSKSGHTRKDGLDLGEHDRSDFHFARIADYPLVPWGPYPVYDYYTEPLPIPIPVAPDFALVDYVHPFYAFAGYPFFDDDDDGLFFRPEDD